MRQHGLTARSGAHLFALCTFVFISGCATGQKSTSSEQTKAGAPKQTSEYLEGMAALNQSRASSERCLTLASDVRGKNWKTLVRHANGCAKANDWKSLEMIAREIARIEIESPWAAYFYSLAAENTKDYARALWMIELALKKNPNAGLFHYQKGRVLWGVKNYRGAIEEIQTALKIDPKMAEAHSFLAQIYHRDQNYTKAEPHFLAALESGERSRLVYEGLGDVKRSQNQLAQASEFYGRAVSQANDDLALRIKLAETLEAIEGKSEQALSSYKDVRDLMKRQKTEIPGVADKIKALESKIEQSKQQQAKGEAPPQSNNSGSGSAGARTPAAAPGQKGVKK